MNKAAFFKRIEEIRERYRGKAQQHSPLTEQEAVQGAETLTCAELNAQLIRSLKALPPLQTMDADALREVIKEILEYQRKTLGIPGPGSALIAIVIRDIDALEAEKMRGIIKQVIARQSVD